MNVYKYQVTLEVEVDAFDPGDAWEAVQDAFGLGENCGTRVVDCEYVELDSH
jgi:hypothetical protein